MRGICLNALRGTAAALMLLALGAMAGQSPVPDLTRGGKPDATHDWTLGPTGARGWIWGRQGHTTRARQILITEVAQGSPADGVLRKGDVILGIGIGGVDHDARLLFAQAIAAAGWKDKRGNIQISIPTGIHPATGYETVATTMHVEDRNAARSS